jgi:hypothetical protein
VYALGLTLLVAMISLYGAIRIARRAIARDEGTELELLGKPNWGQGNFHTNPGSVWQFVESVRNEPNLVMRTDLVAERLAEVDMETSAVATRIGMWARVALYFGAAATVVSVGKVFGRPMDLETFAAFGPFLLGAATAALCIGIGRYWLSRSRRPSPPARVEGKKSGVVLQGHKRGTMRRFTTVNEGNEASGSRATPRGRFVLLTHRHITEDIAQ